jgi:hypothetical protein
MSSLIADDGAIALQPAHGENLMDHLPIFAQPEPPPQTISSLRKHILIRSWTNRGKDLGILAPPQNA